MLGKMFKMMKKGNKGFTLVELMVVVVIIGVLTAIAVPVYNNASKKATANAIRANIRIIEGAIAAYRADNPGDDAVTSDLLINGKYLKEWPKGPKYDAADVTYEIVADDEVESSKDPDVIDGTAEPDDEEPEVPAT